MNRTPSRWEPTTAELDHAARQTLMVLQDERTPERVHRHYDPTTNYAGRSFAALRPNDPNDISGVDCYAVSLLDVTIKPGAGRRLLTDGPVRQVVLNALRAMPGGTDLAAADRDMLLAMEELHLAVLAALGGKRWVTASKLCARKRPNLFPVRDNRVTKELLGLAKDRWTDWLVYQHRITDQEILRHLVRVTHRACQVGGERSLIDDPPLRVLDVALWMYTMDGRS